MKKVLILLMFISLGLVGQTPKMEIVVGTTENVDGIKVTSKNTSPNAHNYSIYGLNKSTNSNGTGVYGGHEGSGIGVHGYSKSGTGVFGFSQMGTFGTGVYGLAYGAGKSGVKGYSENGYGNGILGEAESGIGVKGYALNFFSTKGIGGYFSNASPTGYALITGTGKVGFNIDPIAKLHVGGTESEKLRLENTTALESGVKNEMYFKTGNRFTGAIKTIGLDYFNARMGLYTFASNDSTLLKERISILDDGKVGIGNTAPSLNTDERMEINGRLRIRDSTNTAGVWFNNSANGIGIDNGAFYGLETAVSGSERAGIWIGSAWRFYINRVGNANFTGTVTATGFPIASDFRYKKNIQPLENTLSKVQKIVGVSYDLRKEEFPEKNFSDQPQIGFIAQDLEKIFPEMVFTDEKGYKSVDYARLTPVLVEAMKELTLKNQTLENRIDKIEAMLSTIQPNSENSNSKK